MAQNSDLQLVAFIALLMIATTIHSYSCPHYCNLCCTT